MNKKLFLTTGIVALALTMSALPMTSFASNGADDLDDEMEDSHDDMNDDNDDDMNDDN